MSFFLCFFLTMCNNLHVPLSLNLTDEEQRGSLGIKGGLYWVAWSPVPAPPEGSTFIRAMTRITASVHSDSPNPLYDWLPEEERQWQLQRLYIKKKVTFSTWSARSSRHAGKKKNKCWFASTRSSFGTIVKLNTGWTYAELIEPTQIGRPWAETCNSTTRSVPVEVYPPCTATDEPKQEHSMSRDEPRSSSLALHCRQKNSKTNTQMRHLSADPPGLCDRQQRWGDSINLTGCFLQEKS